MILQYENLPPTPFLRQVHLHCPKAASLYDYLWGKKDGKSVVKVHKDDIVFLCSMESFKDNIRRLNLEGLLNYFRKDDQYIIELVEWDDLDE